MKRAIIVRGNPGIGKSIILKDIYQWIKTNYHPIIVHEIIWTNDLFGVLKIGNLLIGLCTAGDDGHGVQTFIDDCKMHKCDIIIGACRRRGATYDTVRADLSYPYYVIEWCHPENISSVFSVRIATAVEEIKAHLIGLNP